MKKLSILLMTALFLLTFSFTAFAEEDIQVTDVFVQQCHYFFEERASIAIDKNNVDITENFYNDNIEHYNKGDYLAIKEAYIDELSSFQRPLNNNQQRAILTGQASSNEIYTVVTSNSNGSYEVLYIVTARYRCQEGAGKIIDYYTPTVNVTYKTVRADYGLDYVNMNSNVTLLNNNSQIVFNVTFDFQITYQPSGIIMRTETATPRQNTTLTGYAI